MTVRLHRVLLARWRVRLAVACGASAPLLAVHPACLGAQSATGALAGRVADSSGTPVSGATLQIAATHLGAISDSVGHYRIAGLDAGTYQIHVRRLGFAADSFTITVSRGTVTHHNVLVRPVAAMIAGMTVVATRAQATHVEAVEAMRAAPTVVSVISAGEIKALPNANVADAAARLPGVTTERAEGEGEYVEVRGTESRLSNVTIDGVHLPGTAQGQRNPRLDDIPSDLIGTLEVSKTLTADMDASAIGGTVNVVTQVPDGAPHGSVRGEYGAITLLDKRIGEAAATYGGRVGAGGRFGFLLTGSFDINQRTINDIEPTWATGAGIVPFYPNEFSDQIAQYNRTRYGAGLDLDYRLSNSTTLYAKGLYSRFLDHGTLYVFDIGNGVGGPVAPAPNARATGLDTGATLYRLSQSLTPTDQLYSSVIGGRTVFHHDTLSYQASYGGTSEDIVNFRASPFNFGSSDGMPMTVQYNYSDPNVPLYSFPDRGLARAAQHAANFFMSGYENDNTHNRASTVGGQIDVATPHLKFGVKIGGESSRFTTATSSADYTGPPLPMTPFVASFNDPGFYSAIHPLAFGPTPDDRAVQRYENAHPGLFRVESDPVANALGSFWGTERVYAAYTMARGTIGRLSLNGGLRAELTHGTFLGHDDLGNGAIGVDGGSQTYVDLFPSGEIKYRLDDASDVRFAASRAISRPNFSDLAPSVAGLAGDPATTVMIGNPSLRPERAWNLDLLAERFLPASGLISAGAFYKQIDHFIFVQSFPGYRAAPFNDGPNYRAGQPQNGSAGTLVGLEFDYSQRLAFLPAFWSGFGFDINGTLISSWATLPPDSAGVTRHTKLPRQSPSLANLALTYEHRPLEARIAWAWQAANITSYGDGTSNPATGDQYFYDHSQIDASIEWTVFDRTTIEVEGLNLNNAVFGFYSGTPHQHYSFQREYYGQQFAIEIKRAF